MQMKRREPRPPKYKAGEQVGNWSILEYLGYMDWGECGRREHFYRAQCTCGHVEERRQGRIVPSGKHCRICQNPTKRPKVQSQYMSDEEAAKLARSVRW